MKLWQEVWMSSTRFPELPRWRGPLTRQLPKTWPLHRSSLTWSSMPFLEEQIILDLIWAARFLSLFCAANDGFPADRTGGSNKKRTLTACQFFSWWYLSSGYKRFPLPLSWPLERCGHAGTERHDFFLCFVPPWADLKTQQNIMVELGLSLKTCLLRYAR